MKKYNVIQIENGYVGSKSELLSYYKNELQILIDCDDMGDVTSYYSSLALLSLIRDFKDYDNTYLLQTYESIDENEQINFISILNTFIKL